MVDERGSMKWGFDVKRVILLRHAKSDWDASFDRDIDRPLNKRGRKSAVLMGQFLHTTAWPPGRVLCSPALRARQTLELLLNDTQSVEIVACPLLYEGSVGEIIEEIKTQPPDLRTLMLVGHEPTWSNLASQFLGGANIKFVTGALMGLGFSVASWGQVSKGQGQLLWFLPPVLLSKKT